MSNRPRILGLVGGVSWVSTAEYYRLINEGVHQALGGSNYARCVIYSFNFGDILAIQEARDWDRLRTLLSDAARDLVKIGAEAIVLCSGTLHVPADQVEQACAVPLIHMADATAEQALARHVDRVALLGTRYTMEMDFFKARLQRHGLAVTIPGGEDRAFIHNAIVQELARDVFAAPTRQRFLDIIGRLARDGAEGVVLGCTEIPLLLKGADAPVPLFDTTGLHAAGAVRFAVG